MPIIVGILMGNPAVHGATQLTVKQDGKLVAFLHVKVKQCIIFFSETQMLKCLCNVMYCYMYGGHTQISAFDFYEEG